MRKDKASPLRVKRPPVDVAKELVSKERSELALAAGHGWAERKAEILDGAMPAADWPDVWSKKWAGRLPFDENETDPRELAALEVVANHAAAEHWAKLVREHRTVESAEEEELDQEAAAARLFDSVRGALPDGLVVQRAGERVYLVDERGMERTITSVAHAARVVADWKDQRSL